MLRQFPYIAYGCLQIEKSNQWGKGRQITIRQLEPLNGI
jgi:hypothetical protein